MSRVSELLAVVSLTSTCMLFLHTSHLQSQLATYTNQLDASGPASTFTNGALEGVANHIKGGSQQKSGSCKNYDWEQFRHLEPLSLNNTVHHKKMTLVFNRVPKVGSQSTMELLRTLSYKNGFTFHKDRPQKVENIKLTEREQKRLVQLVDVFRPPSVYVKHVCYINFTTFNITQPIYINMVRDPVERVISWYYYVRAPWYFVERKQAFPELPLPSPAWLRKDYETCVRTGDRECQYREGDERPDFAQLTEFFCGQDKKCTGFNTDYALQKAKENVERNYAVVGVLEDLNTTLTVLEHYVPRFFKGAKDHYWNEVQKFSKVNRNIYKPQVPQEVKEIVRKNFTREMEFYEFCRRRLYMQYAALKLPQQEDNC
ncbi:heparan sulfate 2-O-sulfotransferase pipe-like isoform X2 [Portunus trituberculatus]|uniref:heparan sulfate 2-O-sulfotransferase pipe-like isoform X2 n=1 Tax=Portunus trituberculatus TaxID=210409 RepID=UPI001E1CDE99|nr:heparan sulfate 2-O-sulfotransferase pipe-like isoform X2 [Portunus trituberculatus]